MCTIHKIKKRTGIHSFSLMGRLVRFSTSYGWGSKEARAAIGAIELTRNSSLAARESAVTLLTVLESPVRILLIRNS
jgi:hypothetical protein